jgi:hypothetical protein
VEEWNQYINTLQMTRDYPSEYRVVYTEGVSKPGESVDTTDATLYQLFVWLHHYAAKNNSMACGGELPGNTSMCMLLVYGTALWTLNLLLYVRARQQQYS